ncbi:hypothetical protein E6C60_2210 [Paenibacillus algicola]|uniref:Uncharacterized protein n=1 Tax=Paenibacillus algicola TaxID=2565926 RepID=A0A4P8XKQ1_9BACL|nr:hypothetical protein E6C60_2210 [Paenibacillus algicola]
MLLSELCSFNYNVSQAVMSSLRKIKCAGSAKDNLIRSICGLY